MVFPLLAGFAAAALFGGVAVLAWRFFNERAELLRVRELFARYVPEQAVNEILSRPDLRLLWARRHYATVLCCRIRNFGFFAEELSAEDTLRHLNEFYAVAGRAIVRHGGLIERLHSDGITAVFGVLTSDVFQEDRALRAALRIVRLANAMNVRWQTQGRRPFQVYIGVNSGNVVAGEVGFAQRREFAVVGNPANVAARLQQAAEDLNANILAAASTFEAVKDLFVGLPVTTLPLAGLRRLQQAYLVRGLAKRGDEELLRLPPEISALETVIAPEPDAPAAAKPTPQPAHFCGYDDAIAAMPELPPITGDYEEPARSAEAPSPPLPGWWHHTDR